MKILLLGSDGMLGHVIKIYFEEKGDDVVCTTRRKGQPGEFFEIKDSLENLEEIINKIKPNIVINSIGILNKAAEDFKASAVLINSYLPHYLDEISEKKGFKFIHISTDCVFDGKEGGYNEDSATNAENFYGQSKALGEIKNDRSLTLRTSIVGPDENPKGIGLFKWFMDQEGEVGGYDKVLWTGVTTMWLTKCIEIGIEENLTGLHHCVNNEVIDKYSLLKLFKKYFKKNITIHKNSQVESAKTLIRTGKSFDFGIPSYEQMVKEMKEWVVDHKDVYPHLINGMKLEK